MNTASSAKVISPKAVLCLADEAFATLKEIENAFLKAETEAGSSEFSFLHNTITVRSLLVGVVVGHGMPQECLRLRAVGLPLPVIHCQMLVGGVSGTILLESPWENDFVALCAKEGFERAGIRVKTQSNGVRRTFTSADGMLGKFGTLPGTAAHLLVAPEDLDKLGQALRLAYGFLESRLDAVRAETAEVLAKARAEAGKNGLALPYDL